MKMNITLFNRFSLLLSIVSIFALISPAHCQENTQINADQTSEYLVIGTRNIAYSVITQLLQQNKKITVLVFDKEKAEKLFDNNPLLEIIGGAVDKDPELVKQVAQGKKYIFYCPYFPSEHLAKGMALATHNVIQAACPETVIVFPSLFYSVGNAIEPFTEDMTSRPCSDIGRTYYMIEKELLEAGNKKQCKTIIVRHSHAFGPNLRDGLMDKIFTATLADEELPWVNQTSLGYQICYAPDVATIMIELANKSDLTFPSLFNFGGEVIDPIENWIEAVYKTIHPDSSPRYDITGWWKVTMTAPFQKDSRACKDIYYSFERTIILDDSKLKATLPNFTPTAMSKAIVDNLEWFKNHCE